MAPKNTVIPPWQKVTKLPDGRAYGSDHLKNWSTARSGGISNTGMGALSEQSIKPTGGRPPRYTKKRKRIPPTPGSRDVAHNKRGKVFNPFKDSPAFLSQPW
jgi:hypothetical protein